MIGDPMVRLYLPLLLMCIPGFGIAYVYRRFDEMNFLAAAIVGCGIGVFYLLFTYGALALWAATTTFIAHLVRGSGEVRLKTGWWLNLILACGFVFTAVVASVVYIAASGIPVLGPELEFMFEDG